MAHQPFEVRYSRPYHLALAVIGIGLVATAAIYLVAEAGFELDRRGNLWLVGLCVFGLLFYAVRSLRLLADRRAQIVIGPEGVWLGFGRDVQLGWNEVHWVRLRGLRPVLQIGIPPSIHARLQLSLWHLDDNLTAVRGAGSAVGIRGNGLDRSTHDMQAAIEAWQPRG